MAGRTKFGLKKMEQRLSYQKRPLELTLQMLRHAGFPCSTFDDLPLAVAALLDSWTALTTRQATTTTEDLPPLTLHSAPSAPRQAVEPSLALDFDAVVEANVGPSVQASESPTARPIPTPFNPKDIVAKFQQRVQRAETEGISYRVGGASLPQGFAKQINVKTPLDEQRKILAEMTGREQKPPPSQNRGPLG